MTDEEMDNWYKAAKALQNSALEKGYLEIANAPLIDIVESLQSVSNDREFMNRVERKFNFS